MAAIFNNEGIDDPLLLDGCSSFSGGQVSFTRANLLAQNQASLLENVSILINGELRKRRGTRNIGGGYIATPSKRVQGILYFDTALDQKTVAFSAGSAVWYNAPNWDHFFDAAIIDHDEVIDCVQMTDRIFWTDGSANGIRRYDAAAGTSVMTVAGSPSATILTIHGTRLVAAGIQGVPDAVDFSDLLDGETWDNVNQRVRIGAGDGDAVTGLMSWQDTAVLVFKRSSTWLIDADPQLDVADFAIRSIHRTVGCVARKSIAQVGQDVWFLSRSGVQSVQKQLATSNNEITVPVSQPVQDIIGSIRWEHAHKSVARFYNNYYLLSIPVDSNEPDVVLAYHHLTGGWTVFKGWNAGFLFEQPYNGMSRLLIGCHNGELTEWLDYENDDTESSDAYVDGLGSLLLPFDLENELPAGAEVTTLARTRALTFNEVINPKSGFYGEFECAMSDVEFSLYAVLDGRPRVLLGSYSYAVAQTFLDTDLPFDLPAEEGWTRERFPLHHLEPFRELQFEIECPRGKLLMRSLTASAFLDTIELRSN